MKKIRKNKKLQLLKKQQKEFQPVELQIQFGAGIGKESNYHGAKECRYGYE